MAFTDFVRSIRVPDGKKLSGVSVIRGTRIAETGTCIKETGTRIKEMSTRIKDTGTPNKETLEVFTYVRPDCKSIVKANRVLKNFISLNF